jgi:hypothetical protein
MTFIDCTFAGSANAIDIETDGIDFVFDACSFDFNGDVVHFGEGASYSTISMSQCHIEAVDGLIVNSTQAGKYIRVNIKDSIVLPRKWKRSGLSKSPRTLFKGAHTLALAGVEFRFESPMANTIVPIVSDEVIVESLTGINFQKYESIVWRSQSMNAALDVNGNAPISSRWDVFGKDTHPYTNLDGLVSFEQDAEGNRLVVSPGVTQLKPLILSDKSKYAVTPGRSIVLACTIDEGESNGKIELGIDYYDLLGKKVSRVTTCWLHGSNLVLRRFLTPAGAFVAIYSIALWGGAGEIRIEDIRLWAAS